MLRLPHATSGRRRHAILLVALVAFWLAQALAVAHASRHAGADSAGLPGDHSQLCTDCASMLPLLTLAGGVAAALALAAPVPCTLVPRISFRPVAATDRRPFQSRAPPR
jgi:hypothetical protein